MRDHTQRLLDLRHMLEEVEEVVFTMQPVRVVVLLAVPRSADRQSREDEAYKGNEREGNQADQNVAAAAAAGGGQERC